MCEKQEKELLEVCVRATECFDWCYELLFDPKARPEELASTVVKQPAYVQEVVRLWLAFGKTRGWLHLSRSKAENMEVNIMEAQGPDTLGTALLWIPHGVPAVL